MHGKSNVLAKTVPILSFLNNIREPIFFTLDTRNQIRLEEREHHRLVVTVLVIKNTPLDKCEGYFSDVMYYTTSLLHRLKSLGLSQKISIKSHGYGILGRMDLDQLRELNPTLLRDMIQGKTVVASTGIPFEAHIAVDWELYKSQRASFQRGLSMVIGKK